jgi:ornithine cyclodeaminase/alanine dehydrogenase-like protein (mu-crystallin family)
MRRFSDDDVLALSWGEVLDAMRGAFSERDRFRTAERVMLDAPGGGAYLTMPCADTEGWFGVKQVSVLPDNPSRDLPSVQAWYTLFDPDGRPALAGSATVLTRLRTAAVSALAADVLVPRAPRALLVVGTGALAPWLVKGHLQVRAYETVWVWGRRRERAERVVEEVIGDFEGKVSRPAVAVAEDLEQAVRTADVISVATTSRESLVRGAWLRAGQHLDLVGAFLRDMREVDAEAVRRSHVVVDDRAAARKEAGDLHFAAAEGWPWNGVAADLSEVVRGTARERAPGRPTLFKSVGLALEDLVVARLLAR